MLTSENSVSLNCGPYGREKLEMEPVHLRDEQEEGLKIKILYKKRLRETGKKVIRYTEAFLTNNQVNELYDIFDEIVNDNKTEETLVLNNSCHIGVSKSIIYEKSNKGDFINTHGIRIVIKNITDDNNIFAAVTTMNPATVNMFLTYLEDIDIVGTNKNLTEEQEKIANQELVDA